MLGELQKQKLRHTFRLWDSNGDAQVDAADFTRIAGRVAEARGWASGSAEYEQVQQAYAAGWQYLQQFADTNHNHEVSLEEWLACYDHQFTNREIYDQLLTGIAQLNFGAADLDGDGQWTLDEYLVYLRALGAPEDHAADVFQRADVNGDGHISPEMFKHLLDEYFLSDDANAPGNWLLGSY